LSDTLQRALEVFHKIEGVWEGTLTRINGVGTVQDQMKSRVVQRIEGENGWYQHNTFTPANGNPLEFIFHGTFNEEGHLSFAATNLIGVARAVADDIILLTADVPNPPGMKFYEMTQFANPGKRMRTSQRVLDGKLHSVQIFNEERTADTGE